MNRPTIWLFALWSAYIATWAVVTASSPLVGAAWWLAGICVMQAITSRAPGTEAVDGEPVTAHEEAHAARGAYAGGALQDWESEGGAIA